MKTYTHPTINLPCGAVVVKFYDDAGSGTETTPDIITNISDMEEGFDINIGDFILPEVTITMHNKSNYVLGTLFNTAFLRVAIFVDNELHFYGDSLLEYTTKDDPSTDSHYSEIETVFLHHFSVLRDVDADAFEFNVYNNAGAEFSFVDDVTGLRYLYMKTLFFEVAYRLGVKYAGGSTDINWILNRDYLNLNWLSDPVDLRNICAYDQQFNIANLPENGLSARFENALDVFAQLCKDFQIFPTIVHDGTDFKLQIRERDRARSITLPSIKGKEISGREKITEMLVDLDGHPEDYTNVFLTQYDAEARNFGDKIEHWMHHTNIDALYEGDANELIMNGSDWNDADSDGVPDEWGFIQGTASITTATGFTGNVLKVTVGGSGGLTTFQNTDIDQGRTYKLSFKYNSSSISSTIEVRENNLTNRLIKTLTNNPGSATSEEIIFVARGGGGIKFLVTDGSAGGSYILLDEVSLIEVWQTSIVWGMEQPDAGDDFIAIDYVVIQQDPLTTLDSFQLAVAEHYADIYYNKDGWMRFVFKGIKAEYSSSTKLEYLAPGYNFTYNSIEYHIQSVNKSIVKNESSVLAIPE